MSVGFDDGQTRHSRIFNHLNGVEDADERQISGECNVMLIFRETF
jgi:hypothetical protein